MVARFSEPAFTLVLGRHGETLFDAALPRGGFMPEGRNVTSYRGKTWTKTRHDLDRIFERDGVGYGTEIKNTLSYIDREEMEVKLEMCEHLGLTPLFIVRMAPKSYFEQVRQRGGVTLIFEWQLYPFGHEAFAKEVRGRLGLKVDCPKGIQDGTIDRLVRAVTAVRVRGKV